MEKNSLDNRRRVLYYYYSSARFMRTDTAGLRQVRKEATASGRTLRRDPLAGVFL